MSHDNLKRALEHQEVVKNDIEKAQELTEGRRKFIEMAEKVVEIEKLGLAWLFYDVNNDDIAFRLGVNRWKTCNAGTEFEYKGFTVSCPEMLANKLQDGYAIRNELLDASLRDYVQYEVSDYWDRLYKLTFTEIKANTNPRNDESTNIPKESDLVYKTDSNGNSLNINNQDFFKNYIQKYQTVMPKEVKSMVIFKDVLHVATTDGVFAKDRDGKFQRIFTP